MAYNPSYKDSTHYEMPGYREEWQKKINESLNDLKELPSTPLQKFLILLQLVLKQIRQ